MNAVAHPAPLAGPRSGGIAARRAVIRWARRMFRREWRRQLLVVTLLTVAVAAAIGSITMVYNTAPADNAQPGAAPEQPARSATAREFCAPTIMRLNRSRPRRSVPSRCAGLEPARGQGGA